MTAVIYTGYFVDDPSALVRTIPIKLQSEGMRILAHHVTKKYQPTEGLEGTKVGSKHVFSLYAEVVSDTVHTVLVQYDADSPLITKKYPHITMAVARGVAPAESDKAIEKAFADGTVSYFESPIKVYVTEGYFDGHHSVIS